MRILICTTPIRPVPTSYPPFGSLAIIQALRGAGFTPTLLDIDGLRPSFSQVLERLQSEAPDLIGISAVVSTSYAYVKKLCKAIRGILPKTKIVVGGNLAASAEILHRFCDVDVCVIGEGERIIVNLARHYLQYPGVGNGSDLGKIRGVTFLNRSGDMVFTGYEAAIPPEEFSEPDFSILEEYSNIENFINDPFTRDSFAIDPRSYEPRRAGKKMTTVVTSKGCVARCTFCHRWDKGFRQVRPEKVIARIKHLMDRYRVGFVQFGDENFGSDRKATDELIRLLKPLDILWHVAGVRACTINRDQLKRMREAGCVSLYYGFESGSADILQIMEKKLDLSDNYNTARWLYEEGLSTVYQLVLAMPGENHRTIGETIEMVKQITEYLPERPEAYLSINYIQALPGTPVYEYARAKGLIGSTLEAEEGYLLSVSDIDAGDDAKFVNLTQFPDLMVQSWRTRLVYEASVHWYRSRHRRQPGLWARSVRGNVEQYEKGGYFNRHFIVRAPRFLSALYPLRWPLVWVWTLLSQYKKTSRSVFLGRLWQLATWWLKGAAGERDYRSLRHIMRDVAAKPKTPTDEMMRLLRLGR